MTETDFTAHVAEHDSGTIAPYMTCVCQICDDWAEQGGAL